MGMGTHNATRVRIGNRTQPQGLLAGSLLEGKRPFQTGRGTRAWGLNHYH
jgi:hypothetical protein